MRQSDVARANAHANRNCPTTRRMASSDEGPLSAGVLSDKALGLTRRAQHRSQPSVTSWAPTRSARRAGPRPLPRSGQLHPDRRSQVGRQVISRPPDSRRLTTHNCCREQSNRPQAAVSDAATRAHLWKGTSDVDASAPVPLTGSRPLDSSDAPPSRERASGKPLRR